MTERFRLDFYGAAADYLASEAKEVLCASGAGTGKSLSCLVKAHYVADSCPGSRQLFLRQTRKSLNDSILPLWRDEVLGHGHPAISRTSTIPYQDNYRFPNRSEVVVGGLEDADRILSAEYDRIYIFQAEETTITSWEKCLTRLRHRKTPYHQITGDVNPGSKYHWINSRFLPANLKKGKRERFEYRHEDNPTLFDHEKNEWTPWGIEYVQEILGTLTGIRRERLLKHRWVAEEGIILDNYDPEVHLISGDLEQDKADQWLLHIKGQTEPVPLAYFTAGVDWGWDPDPGVIQIWGYDAPRWHPQIRRFRVAEVYKTRLQREEWAEIAVDLWNKFDIRFFSCDRSRPDSIALFNTRIGHQMGREMPAVCVPQPTLGGTRAPGKSEIFEGIDLMREGLKNPLTKHIRTYLVRDAQILGIDKRRQKAGKTTCTEDEVLEWVYKARKEDDPYKETPPDDKCDDHGLDCWRYDEALNFIKGYGRREPGQPRFKEGTYGEAWLKQLRRNWDQMPRHQRRMKRRMALPSQFKM